MEKIDGKSLDFGGENRKALIEALGKVCPEVVSESGVDLEKLSVLLSKDEVTDRLERYNFTWAGKKSAIKLALQPSTGTLRPAEKESVNWENTQNLYIEGDNLEVLKLLQKSYFGKVKMIYIDPPYNTGKEFVYPDDYADNIQNYLELTEQINSSGRRITTNTETSGRYHTNWLNMMYPRLKLARNLLRDDGVIFISIDDNEVSNLRKICDEIFGEENFVAQFAWNCSTAGGIRPKFVSKTHEYILCYAKNCIELLPFDAPLSPEAIKQYNKTDQNGLYREKDFLFKNASNNINQKYAITCPDGEIIFPKDGYIYRFVKETFEEAQRNNLVVFKRTKTAPTCKEDKSQANWNIYIKKYLDNGTGCPSSLLPKDLISIYNVGTQAVQELFCGKRVFDNVKPVDLIEYFLKIITNKNDLVLDFFSGSATTAHAVMQLNAEDGGNRKFIMVQLPEPCDKNSEAFKAGYKNICEIGKERIRRAAKKIEAENAPKVQSKQGELDLQDASASSRKEPLDLGFKVFKLDSSNFISWDSNPDNFKEENLTEYLWNIKEDRSQQDLIYELFIKLGVTLNTSFEKVKLGDKYMYDIGYGTIYACLDSHLDMKFCDALIKYHNEKFPKETADSKKEERELERYRLETTTFIFQDSSFVDDNVKTNIIQTLRQHGLENIKAI